MNSNTIIILLFLLVVAGFILGITFQYYVPGILAPQTYLNHISTPHSLESIDSTYSLTSPNFIKREYDLIDMMTSTHSMNPTIYNNSVLLVSYLPQDEELTPGNIIGFKSVDYPGITAVHRIVRVENDRIFTQGDNNPKEDKHSISREDVEFVVLGVLYK